MTLQRPLLPKPSAEARGSITRAGSRRLAGLRRVFASFALLVTCARPDLARAFPPFAEQWDVPGHPQDVEVDPAGRVWISCFDDSIRVYAPTGGQLLFAFGGSGAGDGQFQNPYGMAFDAAGNAYVCDYLGLRVEKFDPAGNFVLAWPTPGNRTDHVAIDAAGDVYVSGFSDQSVHRFTSAGTPLLDWPMQGATYPSGVVESGGVIHVVQWLAPAVEQYLPDGTFVGSFATGATNATDIEVDASGNLWLADYENGVIREFAPDGTPLDSAGAVGTGAGEFQGLSGLAIGLDGSIYATDEQNSRVQRFGPPTTGAPPGSTGGAPGAPALRSLTPNPCRSALSVAFTLPREERVSLSVHDIGGRRVASLFEGTAPAGTHALTWTVRARGGSSLPAGVYLVRFEHGGRTEARRLVVVH